jgi:protease-4
MTFLRELLAVILGIFISVVIMFMVMLLMVSVFNTDEEITVKKNSVLTLKLDKKIKDYAPKSQDPFENILGLGDEKMGLNKMITAIENAKNDDQIKGISIEALQINAGFAQLQALRDKLLEFKESGKFITSYADYYDQRNYYLSSVADSLYVNPVGGIDFKGLSGEILYFKDFEDKYGIKMEVIRHGKYKSAVEPYLTNKMSDENREQTESFLNSIWSELIEDIGYSRNKTTEELNQIADDLLGRNPKLARDNDMITREKYLDEYLSVLKELTGTEEKDKLQRISLADYIDSGKGKRKSKSKNRIAVIYAQGTIIYGDGDEKEVGQKMMIKAIRKVRKDKNVKAIVLRVNSPGGSGLASDIIWREMELTKKEKPVVVSMGNLAASGGYYISCNANRIFAEPTTITGSIGVFGAVPNIHEFSSNIGINAEQVATNKQSVGYSVFEPISPEFYKVTKEGVEDFYNNFVKKVADGRNMSFEQVDSIAQGRVWTGKQAKENGLVDELGSLEDAIEAAAELADLDDYKIRNYPSYKKDLKKTLRAVPFLKIDKEAVLKEKLGVDNYRRYEELEELMNLKGIQTRLPFYIEIK